MSRIYLVKTPGGNQLVEAGTKTQAINSSVSNDYSAEPISASDLHAYLQAGYTVRKVATKEKKSEAKPEGGQVVDIAASLAPSQPAPSLAPQVGWTPPTQIAGLAPHPVLAEQQRINPEAAAAVGAPAAIIPIVGVGAATPAVGLGWGDYNPAVGGIQRAND